MVVLDGVNRRYVPRAVEGFLTRCKIKDGDGVTQWYRLKNRERLVVLPIGARGVVTLLTKLSALKVINVGPILMHVPQDGRGPARVYVASGTRRHTLLIRGAWPRGSHDAHPLRMGGDPRHGCGTQQEHTLELGYAVWLRLGRMDHPDSCQHCGQYLGGGGAGDGPGPPRLCRTGR